MGPRCCCSCERARPTWTATGRLLQPATSSAARRRSTQRSARRPRSSASPRWTWCSSSRCSARRAARPIDERVDFFFTARSWTGEPRIVEPDKCAELRWCPLTDLPDPVVPHEAFALSRLGTEQRYLTHGFHT